MEGIRLLVQAGRADAPPVRHRPAPAAPRLADLVRRHVAPRPLPLDAAPGLETLEERPGDAVAPRAEPVPRRPAALRARRLLPLRVRPAGQPGRRLVEPDVSRRMAAAAQRERPASAAHPGGLRLDRRIAPATLMRRRAGAPRRWCPAAPMPRGADAPPR